MPLVQFTYCVVPSEHFGGEFHNNNLLKTETKMSNIPHLLVHDHDDNVGVVVVEGLEACVIGLPLF